ncbi:uncharacterized protein FIBRA_06391 [Fibroporia radiculosa]|uniref:SHSP domain-containing protein n=1 Tax=Fibroporia radiculosa TaxID=599839 RepID=J4H419_9APHY|nr:uncharacterized protein FIBRA_06391 [Fibroporia radiculosa]CCM04224.1 predicted protein [Fibroporia radiculosa]
MPHSAKRSSKPRHSFDAFDKLFEKAFAPRVAPAVAPLILPADLKRPMAPEPPTPLTPGFGGDIQVTPQAVSLDPLWDEVRQKKAQEIAASPPKAKLRGPSQQPTTKGTPHRSKKRVTSGVHFKESPDGQQMIATFYMQNVKKEDMHVSFRSKWLLVSWQTVKVTEKREGRAVVRERVVTKHNQTISLPKGTTFDEVVASRDGKHLILTYPNSRSKSDSVQQYPGPYLNPNSDVYHSSAQLSYPRNDLPGVHHAFSSSAHPSRYPHMHPWGHFHAHHGWRHFRHHRPSRFVWFFVGAASASFFFKSREAHEWKARHCRRNQIQQETCSSASAADSPVPRQSADLSPSAVDHRSWGWSWSSDKGFNSWGSPRHQRQEADQQEAAQPSPAFSTPAVDRWDEERRRMQELGKQATDTISELSEVTLDSVLSTVQSLKTKLAENRAQREQHLREIQALKEDQYKMFEEWKNMQDQKAKEQQSSQTRHLV